MRTKFKIAAVAAVSIAAIAAPAHAEHGWSTYHWSYNGQPNGLTVEVGDNVSATWDSFLRWSMDGGPTQAEWDAGDTTGTGKGWNDATWTDDQGNTTDVINGAVVAGRSNPKNCKAVSGTIQACSERYGRTGWLGVAQIWLSGGHIVQATTKVNDTYFNMDKYNTHAWKILVMCQEIGHDYGLGHTDETFKNVNHGTCMDYTNEPDGGIGDDGFNYGPSNEYINDHDGEQLAVQYGHPDPTNFGAREPGKSNARVTFPDNGIGGNTPASWGRVIDRDALGRPHLYELDFGNGKKRVTHVFWAIGEGPGGRQHDDH